MYSPFCFPTFYRLSGKFIIPSSQFLKIFLNKELVQVPFSVFKGIEIFFPLKEFCKNQNKWKSKGKMSGEYGG